MSHRESLFGKLNYEPSVIYYKLTLLQGSVDHFYDGTFYLTKVDDKYRRFYAIKDSKDEKSQKLMPKQELESSKTSQKLQILENHFKSR